jgi:hypothetical protein
MHLLRLYVKDSQLSPKYLIASDVSEYDALLPINNATLMVQIPGFPTPVTVVLPLRGKVSMSSTTLGLTTGSRLCDLPDGLYTLTHSVSPNDKVYTAVYHYRTAIIEMLLYRKIADMASTMDTHSVDSNGAVELTKSEKTLAKGLLLLEGIKGNIYIDNDVNKAAEQYQELENLLASIKTGYDGM